MTQPVIQPSFAAGEIAPALWGRVDLAKYQTGAAMLRNLYVDYRGGASNRPGTQFLGAARNSAAAAPPRLVPFIFNQDQAYILELTPNALRVIRNGSYITEEAFAITGATAGGSVTLAAPGHDFAEGDAVQVSGVAGLVRPNGISGVNGRTFLVTAVAGDDVVLTDPFGFAITGATWTVWSSGGTVARVLTVETPWNASALPFLYFNQANDVMTVTRAGQQPRQIRRLAEDEWEVVTEEFGPTLFPPATVTAEATGATSTEATYAFTYCVTAVSLGTGDESAPSDPATEITRALNPIASSDVNTIEVSWSAVAGADLYRLYKTQVIPSSSQTGGPYTWGLIGETSALSYQDLNYEPDYTVAPPTLRNPFRDRQIVSVTVDTGGSDYISPAVTVADATGTGAVLRAETDTAGAVASITVLNGGTGYTAPTVTIAEANPDGTGSGATATAVLGTVLTNPRCSAYFQQRKVYAGGDEAPFAFWMTRPGLFRNFDTHYPSQDDDAITGVLAESTDGILSLTSMSTGLIALTAAGAFLISGGQPKEAITPSTAVAQRQVSSGAAALQPVVIGEDIVYLQARGSAVRALTYNFYVDSFAGIDVSALASHLLEGATIKEWAWAEEPLHLLWAVRDDGVLLSFAYIKEQKLYGWGRHDTAGRFASVASIPEGPENAVYVAVRRAINGAFHYTVERFASRDLGGNQARGIPSDPERAWFVDCGLRYPMTQPNAILRAGATQPAGELGSAEIVAGGSGYPAAPVVEVLDPTGSGAEVSVTVAAGVIVGVTILARGQGYTAPELSVSGGSGAMIYLTPRSLQSFTTSAGISVGVGDVLRVGGGKGIVTAVASSTNFTCDMVQPILDRLPNSAALPPELAAAGDWSITASVTTVGGLDHLNGQTVVGLADGSPIEPTTVEDGCLELPRAASSIVLGLGYTAQMQTLRLDVGLPTIQGRRKKLAAVTLRTMDTRGLSVGSTFGSMTEVKERQDELYGDPIRFQTGGGATDPLYEGAPAGLFPLGYEDRRIVLDARFQEDGYLCIQQSYPLPCTVLAVVPEVSVGDDGG